MGKLLLSDCLTFSKTNLFSWLACSFRNRFDSLFPSLDTPLLIPVFGSSFVSWVSGVDDPRTISNDNLIAYPSQCRLLLNSYYKQAWLHRISCVYYKLVSTIDTYYKTLNHCQHTVFTGPTTSSNPCDFIPHHCISALV